MRKSIYLVMAVVTALALSAVSPAFASSSAGPADRTTGGVTYINPAGDEVKASFQAQANRGMVNVRNHRAMLAGGGLADFKGSVDCYNAVGENMTILTGTITSFDGAGPNEYFRIVVQDNDDAPDKIRILRRNFAFDCNVMGQYPVAEITGGNLTVHRR